MTAETQKIIQRVKRQQNPMFQGGKPNRTLRIMNKDNIGGVGSGAAQNQYVSAKQAFRKRGGKQKIDFSDEFIPIIEEGDPTPLMRRMKNIEEQFNPNLHDPSFNRKAKEAKQDEAEDSGDEEKANKE